MEDPIYKNSSAESQNESVDKEGLFNSTAVHSLKGCSPENKKNAEIIIKDEPNEEINGYIDINCMTPPDYESLKLSELAKEKKYSPTLIESAIKVMKNLFSPEKVKSKCTSVVSQSNNSISASESSSNSTYTSGKADLFALQLEKEVPSNVPFAPGESSFKSYSQKNEIEMVQIPLTLDPLNNTDESFMTTVSLIDDSFHSAVTHLDEHGEFGRNAPNLKDNTLNNSQNLDLVDPCNETLKNDSCVENTTLKIDNFSSDGIRLVNFQMQNKEEHIENYRGTQTDEGYSCLNNPEKVSVFQAQCRGRSELEENVTRTEALGFLTNINSKGKTAEDVGFRENFQKIALPPGINPEMKNIVNNIELGNVYQNKSFDKVTPSERIKIFSNGFDKNKPKETAENFNKIEVETEIYGQNEIHLEVSNYKGDCVENNISTTTIVLNEMEAVENTLLFLTADDSSTDMSTSISKADEGICSLENINPESDTQCGFAPNCFSLIKQNRSCVSEGNSPKKSESIRTKLNKSDELLNYRIFGEPFEKRLNSDKLSVDFSLLKYSEASKMSNETESNKSSLNYEQPDDFKNKKRGIDSVPNKTNPVALVSQQSFTILTVHDKSLNRPEIEPLSIISNTSEQQAFLDDPDSIISSDILNNHSVVQKFSMNSNSDASFDTEDLVKSSEVKQSTPVWTGHNEANTKCSRPNTLKLHSPETSESICRDIKIIGNFGKRNLLSKNGKEVFLKNETVDGFSPVNSVSDDTDIVFGSGENEAGIYHQEHMNLIPKEQNKINQSPDVKSSLKKYLDEASKMVTHKLNQTSGKKQQFLRSKDQPSLEKSDSCDTHSSNQTSEKKLKSPGSNSKNCSQREQSHTPNQDKLNITFDINKTSPKSNKTFTKETRSPKNGETNLTFDKSESPEPALVNITFDKFLNSQLNQTFTKKAENPGPQKLNETFNKKFESCASGKTIQISDVILGSPTRNESSRTFVLDDSCLEKSEQESSQTSESVDIKESKMFSTHLESVLKIDKTFSEGNNTYEHKTGAFNASQKPVLNEGQPHLSSCFPITEILHYRTNGNTEFGSNNDANDSFFSTKSSNASLFGSDVSTALFNEEECQENQSTDDLSIKLRKMDLNENLRQDSELCFAPNDNLSEGISFLRETTEEQSGQTEEYLNSPKNDKLRCDPDLVQLIREQFSSNDIEKICSVVQDISSLRLSNDILKESEQFDQSCRGNSSVSEFQLPEVDLNVDKVIHTLSPQSFDFLNSIGGKATGRDLSRESLYVKFDPLVQPSANSLIDFTKEGEALAAIEASPLNPHSSSICEQLLTISPQKKPDAIVPPLTPLSHKVKANLNEDKLERLKELQNEIYFLKNLYAERERSNKAKIEEYENQIAKLTGEGCMLEDKLKVSNEREKSLVKKMKEQTQSIGQLKIIMEEYMKMISKLTSELEKIKNENLKQMEALSLEKDSYMTHLQNTEAAFTDVHAKYEKSKKTIASLKANETLYRNTIAEQAQKIEEFKSRVKEAQEKALVEFQKIQEELNETKANHSQEAARLKAQLRKTELKVEALQESLDQKIKENQQLTAICDELIEGKK